MYIVLLYTALTNQTIKKVGIEVFFDPESVLLVLALWCNRGNRSVDSSKKRFLFQRNGDPNPQTQIDPEVQTQKRQQWNKLVFLNLWGKTYPPTVSWKSFLVEKKLLTLESNITLCQNKENYYVVSPLFGTFSKKRGRTERGRKKIDRPAPWGLRYGRVIFRRFPDTFFPDFYILFIDYD